MFRKRLLYAVTAATVAAAAIATDAGAAPAEPPPASAAAAPSVQEAASQAMQGISAQREVLRAAAGDEFRLRQATVDADGSRHVRVNRTHHGLRVRGGDAVLHYRPDGTFEAVSNALERQITVSLIPALDGVKATSAALAAFPQLARQGVFSAAELYIDAADGQPVLAWDVAIPTPGFTSHVFVGAADGRILGSDNGLRTVSATPPPGSSSAGRTGVSAAPAPLQPAHSADPAAPASSSAAVAFGAAAGETSLARRRFGSASAAPSPAAESFGVAAPGLSQPTSDDPPGGGSTPPCCEQPANGTGAGKHTGAKVPLATAFQQTSVVVPISYYLKDRLRGGHLTRDANDGDSVENIDTDVFTDGDNYWSNGSAANRATAAVDAHYGAAVTWDYFKNVLGRNGIADNGVGARSFVHFVFWDAQIGYYTYNAGWSDQCFCMVYGDGGGPANWPMLTAIDVAGHEMAHGVTSATADLNYSSEAGGLNEATSDIFGTLVEFYATNSADAPDYKIGEKLGGSGNPLRWMDDPKKDGASKSCWYSGVGGLDPHYSSGVGNHFFYLLAVGSGVSAWGDSPTCNAAPAVTGIGNDKAGRIWYQALTSYMVSNETYGKARISTINAANDLYGGADCEAVKAAWLAAGVAAQPGEPACGPAVALPRVSNPGNRIGKLGSAVSVQVQAAHPLGEPLTFAAAGLPEGLSMSGTGLISGAAVKAGVTTATVTVTDPSGDTATTKVTFTITGSSGCMPSTHLRNRGFESGATVWGGTAGVIGEESGSADAAHDGTWRAKLGGHVTAFTGTLTQSVTMPSVNCGAVNVKLWVWVSTDETVTTQADKLTVKLGSATLDTLSNLDKQRFYVQKSYSVTPAYNASSVLSFTSVEDTGAATRFLIDDVVVEIP